VDLSACLTIFDDRRHDAQSADGLANEHATSEDFRGLLLSCLIEFLGLCPTRISLAEGVAPDDRYESR
jgi:hypothetical protein